MTTIRWLSMLKNEPRAGVCARTVVERLFLRTEPFISQEQTRQARFRCGLVKDVVMKK